MRSRYESQVTTKRAPEPEWPWRLVLIIVGVGLILMGREMLHQGYLWVAGFDARFGRIAHRPSVDYIVIGLLTVLIGVLPWKPLFRLLERRFLPKFKKPHTHVKWP